MKAFDLIGCGAVATLSVLACLILSTPAWADVFPVELLDPQAAFTNVAGAPVAISGDYLAAGTEPGQYGPPSVSIFNRKNGVWRFQGMLSVPSSSLTLGFGSAVALDGTNLVIGEAYDPFNNPDYAGGPVYVFAQSSEPGFNAWKTADDTSDVGSYYRYDHPLTTNAQELAATEGWTLTVRCRMVDSFGNGSSVSPSCFVDYAINPTNRFLIWFNLDPNLNLTAELNGMANPITLTTNGDGWGAYHTHQIVFDPTNGTADYYFDGVKMNSSPWLPTAVAPLDGVRFGNGSTSGTGSMNWNLVELKTHVTHQVLALYDAGTNGNASISLDPTNQGWTLYADNHTGSGITNEPVSPDFASAWPLQAVLTPDPGEPSDYRFGDSVAFKGGTIIVGAPAIVGSPYSGDAYVFTQNGSHWIKQAVLTPSVVQNDDQFGASVSLDGDSAIVGAPGLPGEGIRGSAYIFVRNGTNWTQQQQLTNAIMASASYFGNAVAIDGNRVAIGADYASNYDGSVSIFERTNTQWTEQDTFAPDNLPSSAQFGQTVALKGNTVVASGYYCDQAYVYELGPSDWVEAANFLYTNNSDESIRDVAFDGQDVVVSEAEQEPAGIGAVHIYSPDYSNPTAVSNFVGKLLYYPNAEGSLLFDPNQAAFRYKTLLYAQGTSGIVPQFTNIANLYGPTEQARSEFAESELDKALALHPNDPGLGKLLLDIYYDRAEAESIFANNLLTEADAARFPTAISGLLPPHGGFVIDYEIPLYEQALATNRYALEGYFSLFTNNLGAAGSPPLGYQIFTNLVPARGLMPATYLDTNGMVQSVTTNDTPLFTGYKDLALLFTQLQNYGETATTLGKLLVARNNSGDRAAASNMIASVQQLLFLNGEMLKGMFATLPDTNDPSGLAQSIDGWSDSLSALTTLQQNLGQGVNPLGFASDFMLYVHTLPTGSSGSSYDTLRNYLLNDSASPLVLATNALQAAENAYATYRDGQDQLADQMARLNQNYEGRLRDIVGAFPGTPSYSDDATNNPGSLLDQQYEIIQQAQLKILENQTDMSNLNQRVQIEIARASSISNVVIHFGNKAASVEEELGNIQAAQAGADAAADTVDNVLEAAENPAKLIEGLVGAANTAAQVALEKRKGQLEAEKEQDAALEQAQITGINSAAAVKTMLLNMNTLEIESQEDALQLQQALNQMAGLYREKQQLEQKIAEQNYSLAGRYYADPIHRLQAQADMVAANLAFNKAQEFLFFMQRALDYKWDTPMNTTALIGTNEITWTDNTIFKLRNAAELMDLFNAMDQFDADEDLRACLKNHAHRFKPIYGASGRSC
jgi:Vibrio cholerae sialidase, lectin insertion/FG-GAP repeat